MFACICGKGFGHSSSLSRHQRGNAKSRVNPCKEFQQYQQERREAMKAQFLEAQRVKYGIPAPSDAVVVNDYDPMRIPEYISTKDFMSLLPNKDMPLASRRKSVSDHSFGRSILRTVVRYFKEIYMHPQHPENWSVVLQNMSSMEVKVRRSGTWIVEPFRKWCKSFVQQFFVTYIKETEDNMDMLGCVLQRLDDDDLWNEVFSEIKKGMTEEYMRMTIKEHHGFK